MKEVTIQELKDYILSQPDDREVDMRNPLNKGCGCVMVHYGRDNNFNFKWADINTGWETLHLAWMPSVTVKVEQTKSGSWWDVLFPMSIDSGFSFPKTYGGLKELLKEE